MALFALWFLSLQPEPGLNLFPQLFRPWVHSFSVLLASWSWLLCFSASLLLCLSYCSLCFHVSCLLQCFLYSSEILCSSLLFLFFSSPNDLAFGLFTGAFFLLFSSHLQHTVNFIHCSCRASSFHLWAYFILSGRNMDPANSDFLSQS